MYSITVADFLDEVSPKLIEKIGERVYHSLWYEMLLFDTHIASGVILNFYWEGFFEEIDSEIILEHLEDIKEVVSKYKDCYLRFFW